MIATAPPAVLDHKLSGRAWWLQDILISSMQQVTIAQGGRPRGHRS